MLRKEAVNFKRKTLGVFGGSLVMIYAFKKYLNFGPGVGPYLGKSLLNLCILLVPTGLMIGETREKMR
jgi:hypothetical protein